MVNATMFDAQDEIKNENLGMNALTQPVGQYAYTGNKYT